MACHDGLRYDAEYAAAVLLDRGGEALHLTRPAAAVDERFPLASQPASQFQRSLGQFGGNVGFRTQEYSDFFHGVCVMKE